MAKRHHDALAISAGAVNPSAIAIAIVDACHEIRAEPEHTGTAQLTSDPAVRLLVFQLASICRTGEFDRNLDGYSNAVRYCEQAIKDEK